MSDLESRISQLERELALKRGYQSVKFVVPKHLPVDVRDEIEAKLREIAESLALKADAATPSASNMPFTAEEVDILKMVIDTVTKKTAGSTATTVPTGPSAVSTQGNHVPKPMGNPRKAKIITVENVRGEGKRHAAPDDELYINNPDKVDDHGMVSATHMKRGFMIKIPLDDIELLD